MFSQVTAFISDLKQGFKSTVKSPYKSRQRRRHGKTNNYHNDDDDDSDSGAAGYGCLGRSVSMEWGLGGSSSAAAARRRRAKSTESLDRMSDHVRSAVSLMELTQGSTGAPGPGTAGARGRPPLQGNGAGSGSTVTTDTWSSSNSSGGGGGCGGGHVAYSTPKRNRQKSKTQHEANRFPHGFGFQQSSRDKRYPPLQQQQRTPASRSDDQGSNRFAPGAPAASAPQMSLPHPPAQLTPQGGRRPNSTSVLSPAFSSLPRTRHARKGSDDPRGVQGQRRGGPDAVDGLEGQTPNGRVPDGQPMNGARGPGPRQIPPPLSVGYTPPGSLLPAGNTSRLRSDQPEVVGSRNDDVTLLECVIDSYNGAAYYRGKLLGKGGFAKCYELNDIQTHRSYAGKIISKARLSRDNQKEKILREVDLHSGLSHRNVVKFHSYFEDDLNVYIVLEYCSRKSLVHVLKHRKTLTEPEVRFYMHSLVNGLTYVHGQRIIHRDLKLGNMLLNENMELKIADFGLATRVEYEGEKKMTVCGTPNYIAPEVLQKKGHSYEADIWALGCIMYALLCGRPPFETATLKETYMRIVTNKFILPPHVSLSARDLISRLLTLDPSKRPPLDSIQGQGFFGDGHFPTSLSPSTCDTRPKFPVPNITAIKKPRAVSRNGSIGEDTSATSVLAQSKGSRKSASQIITRNKTSDFDCVDNKYQDGYPREAGSAPSMPRDDLSSERLHLPLPDTDARLYRMLLQNIEAASQSNKRKPDEGTNGYGQHVTASRYKTSICVTKWVDYSNKYGFGFQLSNSCIGILFNDNMKMLLSPDGKTIQMSDPDGEELTFGSDSAPDKHQKAATLLLYFAQYMDTHLISGGQLQTRSKCNPVFLKRWFRTDRAIVMFLTDGTLQVNFLEDHTKVIINPSGANDFLLTLVNSSRQAMTHPLKSLRHLGCSSEVLERLRYACGMLERTINVEGERV